MTQITPPPSDDDLPDERELAALYARLPKVEPDAFLDAAVLAEAARAMPVSRRPRWPVALASAAVLVLAVGVAWQVRELQPAPVAAYRLAGKSIAAEAAPTQTLPTSRNDGTLPGASQAYVGAASAAKPTARPHANRTAPPAFAAKTAPAPAAPWEPPSPPAPSAPAPAPEAAIVSAAPAPEPPQPEPRQPALQHDEMARPAPSGVLLQKKVAPASANTNLPAGLGPDDRVGEIRRLLGSGNRVQALRELKDLRQRYPRYDLPQDLRDLNP